jgi:hypothetical protein
MLRRRPGPRGQAFFSKKIFNILRRISKQCLMKNAAQESSLTLCVLPGTEPPGRCAPGASVVYALLA